MLCLQEPSQCVLGIDMKDFNYGFRQSQVDSDLRAVLSQVSHTKKMKKSTTVENIVSFGSGVTASHSSKSVARIEEYLQQAVSRGYLSVEKGKFYSLTDSGMEVVIGGCARLPDIDPKVTLRQRYNYGRAMKCTRLAVGTRPKYLS